MVPGGYGAGAEYFEHDVWAARNDELAGLLKVEDAVVDEHLAAVLGAHRAAEFGVGSRAATGGLAIRHRSQSLPADRGPLTGFRAVLAVAQGGDATPAQGPESSQPSDCLTLHCSNLAQDPPPNLHQRQGGAVAM